MNFYSLIVVAAVAVFAVGNPIPGPEAKVDDGPRLYVRARMLILLLASSGIIRGP